VPPAEVGRPAFALLKEKFKGNINAVHELYDFCHKHRIKIDSWSWFREEHSLSKSSLAGCWGLTIAGQVFLGSILRLKSVALALLGVSKEASISHVSREADGSC
jgi:hypothetical protein